MIFNQQILFAEIESTRNQSPPSNLAPFQVEKVRRAFLLIAKVPESEQVTKLAPAGATVTSEEDAC